MSTLVANCTRCNNIEKFELVSKNKYKCTSCGSDMHRCKGEKCNRMIRQGIYCSKCVGHGLKNGGSLVLGGILVGGVVGGKLILKKIGLKNI